MIRELEEQKRMLLAKSEKDSLAQRKFLDDLLQEVKKPINEQSK